MRQLLLLITFLGGFTLGQQTYFPPLNGNTWDSLPIAQLGWQQDRVDSLYRFLDAKNSKSFMMLKGGKRVIEQYFDGFVQDSIWYWASAGKTVAGFLAGMAEDEGLLNIQDKTSDYLGKGWTSCSPTQEDAITIWHQLTMTTGLDDGIPPTPQVPDPANCLDSACLQFLAAPGTRWSYHNAPYRLTQQVIESASGLTINRFTRTRLLNRTGMNGFWINHVFYGRARDMARFGLMVMEGGIWDKDTLIRDATFVNAMTTPSQAINKAYGYLWWLNGQPSFMLPGTQIVFPGYLIPSAPADMVSALGKNDQKVYVVPSLDMIVVRQGNAAGNPLAGPSSFDEELWKILNWVMETTTAIEPEDEHSMVIYPNPAVDKVLIQASSPIEHIRLVDMQGKIYEIAFEKGTTISLSLDGFSPGLYSVSIRGKAWQRHAKLLVK